MRRLVRDSLSPSMVVALLALVVALGGTGFAAVQLGRNSVGSAQIENNSVRPVDLSPASRAPQSVLGPGQTMRGFFAANGATGFMSDAITFPERLPATFNAGHVQYHSRGASFTTECPRTGSPKRGWMCFYERHRQRAGIADIYDQHYNHPAIALYGTLLLWDAFTTNSTVDGQWVVRAP